MTRYRRLCRCRLSRKHGRRHSAAPADRLPRHVLRHVHGVPRHPDRVVVAQRYSGRPVGFGRRNSLGADGLFDRRGDRDSAVGLPVARARHAHSVRDLRRRLHAGERDVRHQLLDRQHDRVARAAGIHRRRHGADRVRLGLCHLSGTAAEIRRAGGRPDRDAGADHRTDGRRLSDRHLLLALAVFHQCRAWHRRHRR